MCILSILNAKAQDVSALIKEADRLEAVPDEMAAFNKFKEVLKIKPTNLHALQLNFQRSYESGGRRPHFWPRLGLTSYGAGTSPNS